MDGYHLQCHEIGSLMGDVELSLYLIEEELEVRVVHVAGWEVLELDPNISMRQENILLENREEREKEGCQST